MPIPAEVRDQNHKKRNLRKEAKIFEDKKTFSKTFNEKELFSNLIEIVTKASHLLSSVGALGKPTDNMKILEMSLNKNYIMLDKSKMLIMKLDKIFIIVPFTITKIEAISRFTTIFLELYAEKSKIDKKEEMAWM